MFLVIIHFVIINMSITVHSYNLELEKVGVARGKTGSQFGYTVAIVPAPRWMNENNNGSDLFNKVLLVGAPNETYGGITGHGQISICSNVLQKNATCFHLNVSDTSNKCDVIRKWNKNRTVCETDSRLGASMKVNRNFASLLNTTKYATIPMVMVCAPGWKNSLYETERYQNYMFGMCIKLTDEILPVTCTKDGKFGCWPFWASDAKKTAYINGTSVFTFAEAGISLAFTEDGYEIIGAPGVDNWKGAFSVPKKGWLVRFGNSRPNTYNFVHTNDMVERFGNVIPDTTYFGYALAAGKYKFKSYILSGVPNYHVAGTHGHLGQVILYRGEKREGTIDYGVHYECLHVHIKTLEKSSFLQVIQTKQSGTKFGSALETVDLTGDGYEEVLVGAPLYSGMNPEEGRVFIYTFNEGNVCGPIGVFSGGANVGSLKGSTTFSRFGTSIASAGDLDNDKFNDVAIGAPYEESGAGAVYIYNGNNAILKDEFTQRISGKRIDPGIQAFGWSVYGNEDIDNNSFPDMVIGAYASDTAVILRSRPVIKVDIKMTIRPSPIPLNASLHSCSNNTQLLCFHVDVHFKFESAGSRKGCVERVSVIWKMNADTLYEEKEGVSRVVFAETNTNKWVENVTLEQGETQIKVFQLIVKGNPEPKDVWTKIRMQGAFELATPKSNMFDILNPVMNKDINTQISDYVEFDKMCDSLDTCTSDLLVEVEMFVTGNGIISKVDENSDIYVGEATELMIAVEVRSLKNTSHNAYFISNVSAVMRQSIVSNKGVVDASCESEDQMDISLRSYTTCKASNILFGKRNMKVKSYYDISNLVLLPDNNVLRMRDYITVEVIAGQNNPDTNRDNNLFQRQINVKLKYRIDIEEDVTVADQIYYNAEVDNIRPHNVIHRYYITNRGPSFLPMSYVNITVPVKTSGRVIAELKNISEVCSVVRRNNTMDIHSTDLKAEWNADSKIPNIYGGTNNKGKDRTKNITCLDETYECVIVECKITDMDQYQQEIIELTIDVSGKELALDNDVYEIRYGTLAIVTDPSIWYGRKTVTWNKPVFAEKWTTFIIKQELVATKVNIWIIISSGVGGLALLCILVIILWKCKFFARKNHSLVQKWKERRCNMPSEQNVLSADFHQSSNELRPGN